MLLSIRAKNVISWLPRDRILLETDGPFAKVKGKILYPSDAISVIPYLVELWGISTDEVGYILKANLKELVS